ncbi:hypothetical protein [Steroidobacter agaridevorans]|nr:hypothetical protein [Steroidobacter agaridevorans]
MRYLQSRTPPQDVAYQVELRASIERGLTDADAGRLIPMEDLMKEFGIEE